MRLAVLFLAITFSIGAAAQIPAVSGAMNTLTPGVGHDYIQNNIETVNPADGSVSIRINVPLPPGRGFTIPFGITYDSSSATGSLFTPGSWTPFSFAGWGYTVPMLSLQRTSVGYLYDIDNAGDQAEQDCPVLTNYVFQEPTGSRDNLGLALVSDNALCLAAPNQPVGYQGYFAEQASSNVAPLFAVTDPDWAGGTYSNPVDVIDADGNDYSFPRFQPPGSPCQGNGTCQAQVVTPTTITDRNGNQIQVQQGGSSYIDAIGRQILGATPFEGIQPYPYQSSIRVGGLNQQYIVNWQKLTSSGAATNTVLIPGTVQNPSSCSSSAVVNKIGPPESVPSIQLPNGQQYGFQYDPASGLVSKITYPGGGYVRYVWGLNQLSAVDFSLTFTQVPIVDGATGAFLGSYDQPAGYCEYQYDRPAILNRYVSYDGKTEVEQQDFSYTTQWASPIQSALWATKTTTVITHDLVRGTRYQTVYTYGPGFVGTNQLYGGGGPYAAGEVPLENTIQTYSTDGTLLQTVNKTWPSAGEMTKQQTVDNVTGLMSESDWQYDNNDMLVQKQDYDFGQGAPGPLLRETHTSYHPFFLPPASPNTTSVGLHIVDKPDTVQVKDGNGNVVAGTSYTYDPVTANTLTASRWLNASGSQALTTTMTYDGYGNPQTVIDPNANVTTYSFADAYIDGANCSFAAPTSAYLTGITYPMTPNGVPHTVNYRYYCATGELASSMDENSETTTYAYQDPLNRLTQRSSLGDGGQTSYIYNDSAPTPSVIQSQLLSQSGTPLSSTTLMDGTGHATETRLTSDPFGTDYVDTTYDGLGRIFSVSNPFRLSATGGTSYTYDSLGRQTSTKYADGNYTVTAYVGNVAITADEAGNSTARTTDALGRLTQVVESGNAGLSRNVAPQLCPPPISGDPQPDSACSPPIPIPPDPPAPNPPAPPPAPTPAPSPFPSPAVPTGAITTYTYDALNNLLTVTQQGVGTETPRRRRFSYDMVSRLLTSTSPETGTIQYTAYDGNGNLLSKTDANGTTMQYTYDALNRLATKSSLNSPSSDDNASFTYDTCTNGIGRLCQETAADGAGTTFSYDPLGRVAGTNWFNYAGGSWQPGMGVLYDLAGNIKQLTYPDGRVVQQTWDAAGRLSGVTDVTGGASGPVYLGGTQYYPSGALNSATLGNEVSELFTLNTRLQPCRSAASTPLLPSVSDPAGGNLYDRQSYYNPAANSPCGSEANNNGNVYAIVDNLAATAQGFGYDGLNRLTSATRPSGPFAYSHTYNYDSFGNMLLHDNVNYNLNYSIDPSTNRLLLNGSDLQYYSNGSLASSPGMSYRYTPEGHLRSINNYANGSYLYNGQGERTLAVHNTNLTGLVWNEYVYLNGQPMADVDNNGNWTDTIYANGEKIAQVSTQKPIFHMHGVRDGNTPNLGCGVQPLIAGMSGAVAGQTIQPGDRLAYDVMQNSTGGQLASAFGFDFQSGFTVNYIGTGAITDQSGNQPGVYSAPDTNWHHSVSDLSNLAGQIVASVQAGIQGEPWTGPGTWDVWIANATLLRADGSILPIFNGQQISLGGGIASTCGGNQQTFQTEATAITNSAIAANYYLDDHLGTTQMELSSGGWPVWQGAFTPFGQEIVGGSTTNYLGQQPQDGNAMRYKFTGKERDAESGLDYFGARYYGSNMGRFMSPDAPVDQHPENPQSWNLYSYVRNNPLSNVDLDGNYDCGQMSAAQCFQFGYNLSAAQNQLTNAHLNGDITDAQFNQGSSAISSYGNMNDHNGVTVNVGATGGFPGTTYASNDGTVSAANPTGQNIQVTFNPGVFNGGNSDAINGVIGHEGSHVGDAEAWAKAGFTDAARPTNFDTEFKAYGVTSIFGAAQGAGILRGTKPGDTTPHLFWERNFPDVVNNALRTNMIKTLYPNWAEKAFEKNTNPEKK